MFGFSPRAHLTSPQQALTSKEVAKAVPELPSTITDLISEMAVTDFNPATLAVEIVKDGVVVDNDRNRQIIACIELALTSPSAECHPAIKSIAFIQATDDSASKAVLKPYMVQIIQGLSVQGLRINLDGVTLTGLNLSILMDSDFSGMSARGATFDKINLNFQKMNGADFTGAKFKDTSLEWVSMDNAIITDAIFSNAWFHFTSACELAGNQSAIFKHREIHSTPVEEDQSGSVFNTTTLTGDSISAIPDREIFTLPASKIIASRTEKS